MSCALSTSSEAVEVANLARRSLVELVPSERLEALFARLHAVCPRVDIDQFILEHGPTYTDSDHFIRSLEPMVVSLEVMPDRSDLAEWEAGWQ